MAEQVLWDTGEIGIKIMGRKGKNSRMLEMQINAEIEGMEMKRLGAY